MRTKTLSAVALAIIGIAGFSGTHYVLDGNDSTPSAQRGLDGKPVFGVSGHDLYASQTAEDWATNADHVVDVTMTAEKGGRKTESFQDRIGTFHVNETLSSRPAARSLPSDFEMRVAGWSLQGDEPRPVVFGDGASRLEVGHRYVLAVMYLQPRCNPDDGVDPGGWATIGQQGAIPFDRGALGEGEVESSTTTELEGLPGTVAGDIASGETGTVDALEASIDAAPEEQRDGQPGDRIGC